MYLVHEWIVSMRPCVISKQADLMSGCSAFLAWSDVCCAGRLTGLYVSTHISHLWFILTLFGLWWGLQAASYRSSPSASPQILWAQYGDLSFSLSLFPLKAFLFLTNAKMDFYELIQMHVKVSTFQWICLASVTVGVFNIGLI